MAQRKTIEQFSLARVEGGFSESRDAFDFLVPLSGPTTQAADDWRFRRILAPLFPVQVGALLKYAYNVPKKAFVVFEAFLESPGGDRVTDMRFWQIVVDSWMVAAGGSPDSLRYVGFSTIINETVKAMMNEEWTFQTSQSQQREYGTEAQRMLTIAPSTASTWDRNPFIRSGVRIGAGLSTKEKTVTCEKAHLIKWHGMGYYMVLEFKNGDPGQETYREMLVRTAEPMVAHNVEQKQAARAAGKEWEEVVFLSSQEDASKK